MEPTDATLARYLLGDVPPEQGEALDERSVVDAAFADRLRVIEQDLADAAARGELSAEDRERWNRTLGASAAGRDELQFARALAAYQQRSASVTTMPTGTRWTPGRLIGLAAAAALAVAVGIGYRMRAPADTPPVATGGASTIASTPAKSQGAPVPAPTAAAPSFVALTLPPPTRSVTDPPVLTIPPGTEEARVTLQLEPTGYSQFAVALRDLRSRRSVWQADLAAQQIDGRSVLPLTVPVSMLHAGRFAFELRGIAGKRSEPIGTYPLTIHITAQ